jgi:hypothetical protein
MAQTVVISKNRTEKLTSRVKGAKKQSTISPTVAAKTKF